jgi:hypothetical protein
MYDQKIHALVSDLDMEKWLIDNLKDRKMLQKFLYLWNSADKYYDAYFDWQIDPSSINHFDFIGKYLDKNKKLAIISFGCGNSSQEKQMLIDLKNQWYNFTYRNETVHILPWEKIELYEIRNYYKPQFLDFFEQHNLKNVDYKSEPYLWDWLFHSQFLFKKNIIL